MSLVLRKWIHSAVVGTKNFTKPIAHLGRIEELPQQNELRGKVKLGFISDKENYIRAIFTRDSLVKYEGEGRTLNNMRGMIISLQDYAILASIGTDRRYSEFVAEIYKFNIISEERHRAVPHIKDVNQDENVQSKLAQMWRDKQQSKDSTGSNCIVMCSQMEESQLSQDQLSQLLSIMNANSQVYSYEAISSSQQIELENIPGWVVKSEQCLYEASQDTTYATPQLDTPMNVLTEQDGESDDTMTYKTPPQGLTSPPVSTTDQHTTLVVQSSTISTSAQESELPLPSQHESELPLPSEQDAIQVAVEQVKDYSSLLQDEVHSASLKLSKPIPDYIKILNSQRAGSGGESQGNEQEAANSPPQANHADEISQFCEMSNSQVADMDNMWMDTQHQPSQCNNDTNSNQCNKRQQQQQQPYTDSLPTSATPNNHDNLVDNTPTTVQTATSNQQLHINNQPASPKGKGGTTKDIHLTDGGKKHSNTDHDIRDHVTSVSTSQQDELDEQWWEDEACCSDPSSLEVFDDLHPFQLESCEAATQQEQPVNTTDIPVQSNIVISDNSSLRLNHGDRRSIRLKRKRKRKVSLDLLDHQLFELAEDSDSEMAPAGMQTSLVSTELITRLLDVSNNKTTSTSSTTVNKTVPQAVPQAASNTHVTFSQVAVEHSYHKREKLQSKSLEAAPKKQDLFSDSDGNGDNIIIDVGSPEPVATENDESHLAADQGFWCNFKPLLTEADIDEFIDTYWARQRLRNMSFYHY